MTIQPPTFGGIVAASDNALCSNDGVLVTWNAVANWGPGGAGWYNVYRSIASPVEPLQANLVGSAPSGTTSYLDGTAQTGVTYSYLVKAESAATGNCLGTPHGGRQDDNTAEIQATEDYLPAPGAPGMIRVELLPDRSTRITWDPIPNASVTNVYRGYIPSNRFSYNHLCWKPDLTGTEVIDIQRPTSGRGWYYLISGENSCGETPLGPDSAGNALPYRIQCL